MCVISLSGLGTSVMVAFYNEFGSVLLSTSFERSLRRIYISSSLNIWENSPVKPSDSGLLFI